jgi:hypothetical protein
MAVPIRDLLLDHPFVMTQLTILPMFAALHYFDSFGKVPARWGYEGPMRCFATAGCLILQKKEKA